MSARLVKGTWCNTEVCHWLDPSMWTLKPPRVTLGLEVKRNAMSQMGKAGQAGIVSGRV